MSTALPRSFSQRTIDGALRAAPLVPLLVALTALNATQPAHAQLPRPLTQTLPPVTVTAPAAVEIDTGTDASPLTLLANHVDIRIVGAQARVRTTLTWRNDGPLPVEAAYRAPLPASLARLADDGFDGCDDALMAGLDDEAAEVGDAAPTGHGSVRLAPGEEVRVTVEREATLIARGDHHRLVLPLYTQRNGAFTPQFSATASIDAARPIVDLSSATHPVEIEVLGESQARLVIPDGRVHEGQFLALDFTLGHDAPIASLPATIEPRWGGETFARIAAR